MEPPTRVLVFELLLPGFGAPVTLAVLRAPQTDPVGHNRR